jgi:PTH1 family peptidyl-tRNA hydrolase
MKLVVGLGNPGKKYERTRHNAGFWLIERFAAQTGTVLRKDAKFQALVGRHAPTGAWLLLPQGFMNASGRPVQMLASFFRISPAEILVVHDELDFAPGVARIKQGGGIAGHNGLKDISARLGSHDYWRLRIGIGHPGDRQAVTDFVLHKPSQEEQAAIDAAIGLALEVLPLALAGDLQGAMLKLHTQEKTQEKARTAEPAAEPAKADKPEKTGKAAPAAAAAKTGPTEKTGKTEKASALKSLFKKFLADTKK